MKFLALLLLSVGAHAATVYPLPDADISVTPNYSNTTTIVTLAGVNYRGPSAFYYVSECTKPDSARYHCNVMSERAVLLTATDGSGAKLLVDIDAQFSSTLITSGHNYWRQSQILLSGSVKTL